MFPNFLRIAGLPLALALTVLAVACGGGGSELVPSLLPVQVQVQITQPSADDNVFTVLTPVVVTASATADAKPVNDGTAVIFSTSPGTASSVSVPSRQGSASALLTGTTPGATQFLASVTTRGQTGTASVTLYLRPQPTKLEVLVPAYFNPADADTWNTLTASAWDNSGVQITAILNPNNGIFSSMDANLDRATSEFVAAGGKVVGYVYTRYGTGQRSLRDIKANVDRYLQIYGRERVGGIFLDEMASDGASIGFYQEIYNYIKAQGADLKVIGNTGLIPAAEYATVADVLVMFEGTGAVYPSYDPRSGNTWVYKLSNGAQAMLTHSVGDCHAMQLAVTQANKARNNTGWVYVTDLVFDVATGVGNPWAALPSYWESFIQSVNALNQNQPLPGC